MRDRRDQMLVILVVLVWGCVVVLGLASVWPQNAPGIDAQAAVTGGRGDSRVSDDAGPAITATSQASTSTAATLAAPGKAATTSTGAAESAGTASAAATTTTVRAPVPLTIAAGGDVIGDRQVGVFIDEQGGEAALSRVAPLLLDADIAFANLESPLSDQGARDAAKDVTFRGRPALVDGLAAAGIDVVSLANNHALDYGSAALADTIARLDAAGVEHAGAGATLADARAPAVIQTDSGSVAFLAYSNVLPEGFPAGPGRSGVNPMRPDRERVLADVTDAARTHDWVVVSLHWGIEYQGRPEHEQRVMAHDLVDVGADLVLGHHPHVLQGLEVYRNKLIAYSVGDFVFDHYSRETGEAFVLAAKLYPAGPPTAVMTPIYLSDAHGIPRPVSGDEADVILDRLNRFSDELGVRLVRDGDRSLLPLP